MALSLAVHIRRADLQLLARTRLREAGALLAAREWSGAYYLSGYAIECGLKAAIAKQFQASTFPDKDLVLKSYTHDLSKLVGLASLQPQLDSDMKADPTLEINWQVVKDWSESARYRTWPQADAEDMLSAITGRRHGVMKWLKSVW